MSTTLPEPKCHIIRNRGEAKGQGIGIVGQSNKTTTESSMPKDDLYDRGIKLLPMTKARGAEPPLPLPPVIISSS